MDKKLGVAVGVLVSLLSFGQGFAVEGDKKGDKNQPVGIAKNVFSLTVTGGDTLRAKIKKVPLEAVLQELANQTDLLIEVDRSVGQQLISAEFDSLPLEEGVKSLLRNKNYVLMYKEVPSTDGSPPVVRVEGIRVAGVGGMGVSPLFPIQREGPKGEPFPITTREESGASDDPRTDNATINPMDRKYGVIYTPPVPPRNAQPGTTNSAPGRVTSPNGSSYNSRGADTDQTIYSPPQRTDTTYTNPDISGRTTVVNTDISGRTTVVIPADKSDQNSDISFFANIVQTSSDHDAQADALDEIEGLATDGRMDAIPVLQHIARSHADSDIRERAQDIIEYIHESTSDE